MKVLRTVDGRVWLEVDGGMIPIDGVGAVENLIEAGTLGSERIAEMADGFTGSPEPVPDVLATPFRPGKILALGRNYAAHAREMGSVPALPFFFAKLPSCCVGHGEPIVIPHDLDGEVHHEVELAVVIGRAGRRIEAARALDHVAGYAVIVDVTARTLQARAKEKGKPWTSAKNLDTFAPLGPGLVPADAVADPGDLAIRLSVNGEIRQDGSTRDMLLPIPETLAHLSRHLTLEPGDLIATGTPAGVGPIRPGDTVEAEIESVGRLVNPVVLENAP